MSEADSIVKVRCPTCEKKLGFPQVSVGKGARCPGCRNVFVIEAPLYPAAPAESRPSRSSAESERITVHCPSCNKKMTLPVLAAGRKAQCPVCEERFTVSAPVAGSKPVSQPVPAEDDESSLFSVLADAESHGQTLAEQPALPTDFKVREVKPLKPEAAEGRASSSGEQRTGAHGKAEKAPAAERSYSAMESLVKGCAFSGAGALIGALVWYGVAKAFSIELGYIAWGLGVLAGIGMHIGIKNESALAGFLAALFALGGIVAGKTMYVAWVLVPMVQGEIVKEMNSIENQRSVLIDQESSKILKARNINPDEANEAQGEAAYKEAKARVGKLSDEEVRQQFKSYTEEQAKVGSGSQPVRSLKDIPTGVLVLLVGLMFGFKDLIFVILGMATAFKLGYDGGGFG